MAFSMMALVCRYVDEELVWSHTYTVQLVGHQNIEAEQNGDTNVCGGFLTIHKAFHDDEPLADLFVLDPFIWNEKTIHVCHYDADAEINISVLLKFQYDDNGRECHRVRVPISGTLMDVYEAICVIKPNIDVGCLATMYLRGQISDDCKLLDTFIVRRTEFCVLCFRNETEKSEFISHQQHVLSTVGDVSDEESDGSVVVQPTHNIPSDFVRALQFENGSVATEMTLDELKSYRTTFENCFEKLSASFVKIITELDKRCATETYSVKLSNLNIAFPVPEPDAEVEEEPPKQSAYPTASDASEIKTYEVVVEFVGIVDTKRMSVYKSMTMAQFRSKAGDLFHLTQENSKKLRIFLEGQVKLSLQKNYGSKHISNMGILENSHVVFAPKGCGGGKPTRATVKKSKETQIASLKDALEKSYQTSKASTQGKSASIDALDMKAQVFANALEQNAIVAFDGMVQSLDINALNKVLDAISSTSGNPDFKLKKASFAFFGQEGLKVESEYHAMENVLDTINALVQYGYKKLAFAREEMTNSKFTMSDFKKVIEIQKAKVEGAQSASMASTGGAPIGDTHIDDSDL